MGLQDLTFQSLLLAALVVIAIITVYNVIMVAVKNWRDESKRKSAPYAVVADKVTKHEDRITDLESDMKEVREGQKHMIRGVQALLEHELHNGNSQQMQAASDGIGKWLTNKI